MKKAPSTHSPQLSVPSKTSTIDKTDTRSTEKTKGKDIFSNARNQKGNSSRKNKKAPLENHKEKEPLLPKEEKLSEQAKRERDDLKNIMQLEDESVSTTSVHDSEDDNLDSNNFQLEIGTEAKSAAPDEPQEIIKSVSGGKRRGKRKVKKYATTKDEEGFLVTKEEEVWESFSEDENISTGTSNVVRNKPTTVNIATKKKNTAQSKPQQKSIMSFFGKK